MIAGDPTGPNEYDWKDRMIGQQKAVISTLRARIAELEGAIKYAVKCDSFCEPGECAICDELYAVLKRGE